MANPPHHPGVDDEEPTDPMLDDPPGARPKRPSLAPALSTRISEVPRAPTLPPPPDPRSKWILRGALLAGLALVIVILGQLMAPNAETLPALDAPSPVPDPEPSAAATPPPPPEPSAAAEPVPVPDPEPAPPPSPAPAPAEAARPSPAALAEEEPESGSSAPEVPPEHLAVVVHPSNPVDSLSAADIRRIYLEDRSWPGGGEAKPVGRYLAPALRKVFLELVLGTNHQAIKEHWESKKAVGLERVRRLPTNDAVVQFVSKRPEAIGYVDWAQLSAEQREQVKRVFEIRLR